MNPDLDAGEHTLADCDTTYYLRKLSPDQVVDQTAQQTVPPLWISAASHQPAAAFSPRFQSPSQCEAANQEVGFEVRSLPGSEFFPERINEMKYAAIGNAVHAYLASMPSIRNLDQAQKERVANRSMSAYSVTGLIPTSVLVDAGERFSQWVEAVYPKAQWHVEVPISSPGLEGGQWNGAIDLLLQLADGGVVIIDHKSAPIRREHCARKAAEYAAQLLAYEEMLGCSSYDVRDSWIHFPLAGVVARKTSNR